jgi:hypothetical protein
VIDVLVGAANLWGARLKALMISPILPIGRIIGLSPLCLGSTSIYFFSSSAVNAIAVTLSQVIP